MHLLIPLLLPLIALTSATPLPGTPLESTPFDPIAPSTTPYAISLACGTCLLQPCFVATAQCIPLCASGNMGTGGGVFDQKRCRTCLTARKASTTCLACYDSSCLNQAGVGNGVFLTVGVEAG